MKTTGRCQAAADGLTRTGDSPSLWRTPAFRSLFGASVPSHIGTNVSYVAVPLLAVTELHASPGQIGALDVLGVSLRQRMTEDSLLGRMNATFRFMFMGALAIGSAISGVLTELTSLRTTLWAGGACLALAFLPVHLSPVRRRTDLPQG
ncbi:hypothetical protein ACFVY1_24720 [Streptomyces sp. NPDC058293]|uniref:hypothetical protein n=1 Tax=Streptomyces sp. NPDC058293 TaxID=3346429 RepID=UPI0036E53661